MKIIGILIITGVILWLFIVTLPYIWWLWLLIVGFLFIFISKMRSTEKPVWDKKFKTVRLDELYKDKEWKKYKRQPIIPIGVVNTEQHKNYGANRNLVANLANSDFNLIIGGATNGGKTTFLNCAIVNLLRNTKPTELKLILIEPKRVEFGFYKNIPQLLFPWAINIPDAKKALSWCVHEIDRRIELMSESGAGFIDVYNEKYPEKKLARIVIIIDEVSDLMYTDFQFFKDAITKICSSSRVTGIHIILTTSRPEEAVYPQDMVSKFQYRIAFATASLEDSKVIIGQSGGEKLFGQGPGILSQFSLASTLGHKDTQGQITHFQGFYISEKEIEQAVKSVKNPA